MRVCCMAHLVVICFAWMEYRQRYYSNLDNIVLYTPGCEARLYRRSKNNWSEPLPPLRYNPVSLDKDAPGFRWHLFHWRGPWESKCMECLLLVMQAVFRSYGILYWIFPDYLCSSKLFIAVSNHSVAATLYSRRWDVQRCYMRNLGVSSWQKINTPPRVLSENRYCALVGTINQIHEISRSGI